MLLQVNPPRRHWSASPALCLLAFLYGAYADAHVLRVTVESRESSAGGQYERLAGRFTCELDPGDRSNSIINDIKLAPRNVRGRVEYTQPSRFFGRSMRRRPAASCGTRFRIEAIRR